MKKILFILCIIVSFAASCDKEDPGPAVIELKTDKLYRQSKYQFENPSDYTWKSQDPLIGTVDANGLFEARKIGDVIISATSKDGKETRYKLTVHPRISSFRDPYLDFGKSRSDVKKYEKRTIKHEDDTVLEYKAENGRIIGINYNFDKNGKFTSVVFLQLEEHYTDMMLYGIERYPNLGGFTDQVTNRVITYCDSDDKKIRLAIDTQEIEGVKYSVAVFMPRF